MTRYAQSLLARTHGFFLSGLLLVSVALPALAHDKWIEVEPAVSSQPALTKIYLATGEALKQSEFLPERRRWRIAAFELRTGTDVQDLRPRFREDAQPIAALPALPEGTSVLRIDTQPVEIELAADKFSSYLLEERLIDILAERKRRAEEDRVGRERYSRSMKALVQVGQRVDLSVTQPVGQTLEIVPLSPPLGLTKSGTWAVRVLFRGQPLVGCAIAAAHRVRSRTQEIYQRTDAIGVAQFTVEPQGQWLLHTVHMHRAEGTDATSDIDWRSHWASLFFAFPEAVR